MIWTWCRLDERTSERRTHGPGGSEAARSLQNLQCLFASQSSTVQDVRSSEGASKQGIGIGTGALLLLLLLLR